MKHDTELKSDASPGEKEKPAQELQIEKRTPGMYIEIDISHLALLLGVVLLLIAVAAITRESHPLKSPVKFSHQKGRSHESKLQ